MASLKVEEVSLKIKNHPEHKYSVTFLTKVGTTISIVLTFPFHRQTEKSTEVEI